jgi:uncharacterized protein YjiK
MVVTAWCFVSIGATSASAELTLIGSFATPSGVGGFDGPDGVAFHPGSGNLFVADSATDRIIQMTTAGAVVTSFQTNLAGFPEGIDVLPNGNLVVCDQNLDNLTEYTTAGALVGTIDISASSDWSNGVAHRASDNSYFVTDDDEVFAAAAIYHFGASGNLIATIDTAALGYSEPEGIEYDPVSGHVLMVEDDTDMFVELTTSGTVLDTIDLAALTGFDDPEGLGYDAANGILYVAFDGNDRIANFRFTAVPEPASLALVGLGGGLLLGGNRRRLALGGGR